MDVVEFYGKSGCIATVITSMVPTCGSFISILGKAWKVSRVTYALDYAGKQGEQRMRANVDLDEVAQ